MVEETTMYVLCCKLLHVIYIICTVVVVLNVMSAVELMSVLKLHRTYVSTRHTHLP